MNRQLAAEMTKAFEGFRERVYLDTDRNPTVGYGTHLYPGRRVPRKICEELFDLDYRDAEFIARSLRVDLDPVRMAVVVDMSYNMGALGMHSFQRMVGHLMNRDFAAAAKHMRQSKWFSQVGRRGRILAEIMETGTLDAAYREGILDGVDGKDK